MDIDEKRKDIYSVLDTALLLGSDYAYQDIQDRLAVLDAPLVTNVIIVPTTDIGLDTTFSCEKINHHNELSNQLLQTFICAPLSLSSSNTHLPMVAAPSLDKFEKDYMLLGLPVVLTECVTHWPALSGPRSWSNLNYIKQGKLIER